ncbi:MAG: hypothetical protein ACYTGU_16200 [Planctomycetota bacterium]
MSHRRLFFAALAVVCLTAPGCGNSARERMIGTWVLDLEATKSLSRFQTMPEEQKAVIYKNLGGMALEVTFTQNTMTKQSSAIVMESLDRMKETVSGTYTVNKKKGNTLVLAVQTSDGMKRVGVDLRGEQQMILDMDESKVVLKRKSAQSP